MSSSELLILTMHFSMHMFLDFCMVQAQLDYYYTLLHVQTNAICTVSCRTVGKIHEQCFIMH